MKAISPSVASASSSHCIAESEFQRWLLPLASSSSLNWTATTRYSSPAATRHSSFCSNRSSGSETWLNLPPPGRIACEGWQPPPRVRRLCRSEQTWRFVLYPIHVCSQFDSDAFQEFGTSAKPSGCALPLKVRSALRGLITIGALSPCDSHLLPTKQIVSRLG